MSYGYLKNHESTQKMQSINAAHHLHPFSDMASLNDKGARVITSAQGVFVYDSDGNHLLDAMAGLWCVAVGYGRTEIIEAAYQQMQQLCYYNTFFQTTHPPVLYLAEKLCNMAPDDYNHAFFCSSGSEANDTIVRMVRHYWHGMGKPKKHHIISRKNGYHGSTMAGQSLGGMDAMHHQGGIIQGISHIDQPYYYGEGFGMSEAEFTKQRTEALRQEIEHIGSDNVAAFIGEPVQGAGGVVIPPKGYWQEIEKICQEYDILLICDEVICGFGRTGYMFGSESYQIKPDMMPIAKSLSSGYLPIGGVLVNDKVNDIISHHGEFYHGYTYSGHPACAAAAIANLDIIERENLVNYVKDDISSYFAAQWATLSDHELVGEARSYGLLGALELTSHTKDYPHCDKPRFHANEGDVAMICREYCLDSGLIMRAVRDSMIVSPPLVINHEEVDLLITRARKALDLTYYHIKKDDMLMI